MPTPSALDVRHDRQQQIDMNTTGVIFKILKDDAAVSAAVGQKIYPVKLPQGVAYPAVVVSVLGENPINSKDGAASDDFTRLQVSVYANSYKQTLDISRDIRTALDFFDGLVDTGLETWDVKNIEYLTGNDVFEPEKEVYHRASDYEMMMKMYSVDTVTFRWLLEDGTGYWSLENNSGFWSLEAA